jgi:predicted TIM-barrel fold metal-dependent hydrolase
MLIDIHTHCFADGIYEKAMAALQKATPEIKPSHDGSLNGLIKSMDESGVDISVVQNIATKPSQTPVINDWAISIANDKIIPFGTIHPDYDDWEREIDRLKAAGIKGVKFHPDYQGYFSDDRKAYPIYEKLAQENMIAFFHCGFDVAFPNLIRNTPNHMKNIVLDIPELTVVGAHMGGHRMYDEVAEILTPLDLYIDTSFAHYILGDEKFTWLIKKHGVDKVVFGSDSPWDSAKEQSDLINRLDFTQEEKDKLLYKNAKKILGI